MARRQKPVVGDYGSFVYIRLRDEDGTPIDPALAGTLQGYVMRPDGSIEEIDIIPSPDAERPSTPDLAIEPDKVLNPTTYRLAGGWTRYTIQRYLVDGDSTSGPWLNKAGDWTFLAYYETGAGGWSTPAEYTTQIRVYPQAQAA